MAAPLATVHQHQTLTAPVIDGDGTHAPTTHRRSVAGFHVQVPRPQAVGAVVAETPQGQWRFRSAAVVAFKGGVLRTSCCPSGQGLLRACRFDRRGAGFRSFLPAGGADRFRAVRGEGLDSPPDGDYFRFLLHPRAAGAAQGSGPRPDSPATVTHPAARAHGPGATGRCRPRVTGSGLPRRRPLLRPSRCTSSSALLPLAVSRTLGARAGPRHR